MTIKGEKKRERNGHRNEQIRKEYEEQWKKGLRTERIFETLAKKYFLSVVTIESIVCRKGVYADF